MVHAAPQGICVDTHTVACTRRALCVLAGLVACSMCFLPAFLSANLFLFVSEVLVRDWERQEL